MSDPLRRRTADGHTVPFGRLGNHHARAVEAYRSGDYGIAAALFDEVLRQCRRDMGLDARSTLTVAGNLAVASFNAGHRREGLALIRAAVADRTRVLGEHDQQTMAAREALATALRLTGHADDAVGLAILIAVQRARVLGSTHPDALTSRMTLALAYGATGDVKRANANLRSTIDAAIHTHGPDHPFIAALLKTGKDAGLLRPVRYAPTQFLHDRE